MLAVIQRVTHANVVVNNNNIGAIQQGIVALLAVEKGDGETQVKQLINRILKYRIFADSDDKMNLSLLDIGGGLLLVPQFTLAADTKKGTRPSFTPAAPPSIARPLFNYAISHARQLHTNIACGEFGTDMQVSLCNDGPVTFILKSNSNS
ncbi:MAG: D-tyrosyl-tRNA(Tyr) deacylase [Piscirickettsiaceae bacterium]|nr:MAG: D-tyrosyl-tRNA(Tyr) deacylase [Piscirickettsiaceae bacterium]